VRIRTVRDFSTIVRGRRRDAAWSQQQLADRADVSRSWLANLERGQPSTEVSRLFALLDALGLVLDVSSPDTTDGVASARPRAEVDLDEHLGRYER
jgi:transcriptional regulator with XRE-family HTH domain